MSNVETVYYVNELLLVAFHATKAHLMDALIGSTQSETRLTTSEWGYLVSNA